MNDNSAKSKIDLEQNQMCNMKICLKHKILMYLPLFTIAHIISVKKMYQKCMYKEG